MDPAFIGRLSYRVRNIEINQALGQQGPPGPPGPQGEPGAPGTNAPATDLTPVWTAIAALEARVVALETLDPEPVPPITRLTMAYYLPASRMSEAVARGVTVGHCYYNDINYMNAAQAAGMKVDVELAVHTGGWTTGLIASRLAAIIAAGHTNTVRRLLLIDEPDGNWWPDGHWNMDEMRSFYAACHAAAPWPVWVTVRAHSSSLARCIPWFATNVSDGIAWDPYLAAFPNAEGLIQNEALAIRAELNKVQANKPLTCVLQASYIDWAQSLPTYPAVRPTAAKVLSMGLAAKAGTATDFALWMENDWSLQPTTPPTWDDIAVATAGWQDAPAPPAADEMTVLVSSTSGVSAAPTVAKPAGSTSGDKLVVIVNHNNETVTCADNNGGTPTTEQGEHNGSSGSGGFAIYTRIMGASEPSSYTYTLSSSQRWSIVALAFRDYDAGSLFDVAPAFGTNQVGATSIISEGITLGVSNAWAIAVVAVDGAFNGTISAVPSGWTELAIVNTDQPIGVAYKSFVSAQATGNASFTKTALADNFAYSLTQFSIAGA